MHAKPIRVILFGSASQQKKHVNDLDFLVVVPDAIDTRAIAHMLYRSTPRLGISLDFVVVTFSEAQILRQDFWSVVHEAESKGKELYVAKTA